MKKNNNKKSIDYPKDNIKKMYYYRRYKDSDIYSDTTQMSIIKHSLIKIETIN